jgi:hypothetical protein
MSPPETNENAKRGKARKLSLCVVYLVCSAASFADDSPANSSSGQFLVSSIQPYQLAQDTIHESATLTGQQIGQLASMKSGAAKLVQSDLQSRTKSQSLVRPRRLSQTSISSRIQASVGIRLQQSAAANGLKLHYAIAACLQADSLFEETTQLFANQLLAQAKLVEAGIPIPDPLLINRLAISLEDQRLLNHSKLETLRKQLFALIECDQACTHAPVESMLIVPSDSDVCEHIQLALRCRSDLCTLRALRLTVSEDSLSEWDSIGASLAGMAAMKSPSIPFWFKLARVGHRDQAIQEAIASRSKWLEELIGERAKQIALEVEQAFDKKKTAALRWSIAQSQIANWDQRIQQLQALSEAKGNLAEQLEAKLNRMQTLGQQLERWLEWHQADIEMHLAIGDMVNSSHRSSKAP